MNYEANKIDWKIGDLVIHDCDAKSYHMLARVTEIKTTNEDTKYKTEYLDKKLNYQDWWNTKDVLHNPKIFDLT